MRDQLAIYKERLTLFKKYGYDIIKARNFVIAKAGLRNGKILEIGTGKGYMALALAKRGFKFTAIDLDKESQAVAKTNLKAIRRERFVTFKIMDAERLRYGDNEFDYVVSVNFIHHAKNPLECLKEMARVTKDKLIIADLNRRGQQITDKVHRLDGHKHEESKLPLDAVKKILEERGLVVKTYRDRCQTVLVSKKG